MAEPETVQDLTVETLLPALHRAEMRLQVYVAGQVHGYLIDAGRALRTALIDAGGEDGALDGLGLSVVVNRAAEVWRAWMTRFQALLETARREAVAIAFGALPVLHDRYFGALQEARGAQRALLNEEIWLGGTAFFEPQLEAVLRAAGERLYGDGLRLSRRIWRLDEEGLAGIRGAVYAGVADSKSAWQIAEEVEQYLGAGQGCPRWTRYRLYGLTKTQIAQGHRGGLYSGDECAEQGVAYKALRLARTEIQTVHHLAGQRIREQLPFVEGEQVVLSPAHPRRDICDEVIEAAPNGDGVYAVGEVQLPLHPNCICDQRAVMMDPDAFVDRLRGWVDGSEPWAEMDGYASWVGMQPATMSSPFLEGLTWGLQLWLFGSEDEHNAAFEAA